jgi:hypothetical protein
MDLRLSRSAQARLDLIEGLKVYVAGQVTPALRTAWEGWKDTVPEEKQRDRAWMAGRLEHDPIYQSSRGLQRLSQEAMWAEVIRGLDERRPGIEAELDAPSDAPGSLRLDPGLPMPDYYEANEFHLQPGNFHRDTLAGPIYELGVAAYTMHRYGRAGDEMGRALVGVLPKKTYRRTLYLGCGPGYKSYPIVDALPDAEHWGIDLAAPMLKYARHRAVEHGRPIHFAQANAECTGLPEGQFDLIYCMLLLHEVPTDAVVNIVNEASRLLAPGGVFCNLELPSYAALDPLSAYLMDWDTDHNGEPFWRAYHEMDLPGTYRAAGLEADVVQAHSEWGGAKGNYMGKFSYHVTMGRKPEA